MFFFIYFLEGKNNLRECTDIAIKKNVCVDEKKIVYLHFKVKIYLTNRLLADFLYTAKSELLYGQVN